MARSKVKLAFIINDSTRRATYKKRRASFMKKMNELTTLCGVEACTIINNSSFDDQPTIWPSVEGAKNVIEKFKNMGEMERGKRSVNHESFTKNRIEKMEEKLKKMMAENRDRELVKIMFEIIGQDPMILPVMLPNDYMDLDRVISQQLWEIQRMMTIRLDEGSSVNPPPPPPLLLPPPPPTIFNVGDGVINNAGDHFNTIVPQPDVVFTPFNMDFSIPFVPPPLPFHRMDYPSPPPPRTTTTTQMGFSPPEMSFSPLPDMGFNPPSSPPDLGFLP